MNELILDELKNEDNPEADTDTDTVKVVTHETLDFNKAASHDGDLKYHAKYVTGTGANSGIRRMRCVPFEGFTYPGWKMIGIHVPYDYPKHEGYAPLNFIVDEVDWAVIAYTGEEKNGEPYGTGRPQWRVAVVEDPNLPADKDSIMARAYKRVKTYINPGDGQDSKGVFTIARAEP